MVKKVDTSTVKLWGETIGAVAWLDDLGYGAFEYEKSFLNKNLNISPIHMSLDEARSGNAIFSFPSLGKETFLGLPGMLADTLPDKFGNNIIDTWLARNGRDSTSFSPVERLCYTGQRGMGALEFTPAYISDYDKSVPIEIASLVELTQKIMKARNTLDVQFGDDEKSNKNALLDILRVGTSAGGARAKAVVALDDKGNIRSGQIEAPKGYDYWLLKFDGVNDLELGEPASYGRIEYAYYEMALAAGINMTECRLLEENGRAHFLTKRFDRVNGEKVHMQSLCGIAHFDFNMAGAYGYEQAFSIMRKLRLTKKEAEEQYRRMVFNIIARNQDDHTKNISFLMDKEGRWTLSPAYDVNYSHNPAGEWTSQHQMSINGKRDNFTKEDLLMVGSSISLKNPNSIVEEVISVVKDWKIYANNAGLKKKNILEIEKNHRTNLI